MKVSPFNHFRNVENYWKLTTEITRIFLSKKKPKAILFVPLYETSYPLFLLSARPDFIIHVLFARWCINRAIMNWMNERYLKKKKKTWYKKRKINHFEQDPLDLAQRFILVSHNLLLAVSVILIWALKVLKKIFDKFVMLMYYLFKQMGIFNQEGADGRRYQLERALQWNWYYFLSSLLWLLYGLKLGTNQYLL